MSKIIHLFRHGQTDWNVLRRMQGHTDIPLNAEGRQQAITLQSYFQENPVDLFMSSDLIRAHETAQIANAQLQVPLHSSPGFREAYLGVLEGMTQLEAHEKFGVQSWEKWISLDPVNFDFAFPEGESTTRAVNRFTQALMDFCQSQPFLSAGVCTHGLIMRRFLHSLKPELKEALPIPNCVVYRVEWNETNETFSFLF